MNAKRKISLQEKKIAALTTQNNSLKEKIDIMEKELKAYSEMDSVIVETKDKLTEELSNVRKLREKYQDAIYEAQEIRKKYNKQFKQLMNNFKHRK